MNVNYLSLQETMHGLVKNGKKSEKQVIKQKRQGRKSVEMVPVKEKKLGILKRLKMS